MSRILRATFGEAVVAAFTPDGRFRTGDIGSFDDDGHLQSEGPVDDVLNRGGEMIAPEAVEQVVAAHPRVAAALVAGFPHPSLGVELGAVVVLEPGAAPLALADLRSWLEGRASPSHRPARLVTVEALPLTPASKPDRRAAGRLLSASIRSGDDGADTRSGAGPERLAEVRSVWLDVADLAADLRDDDSWFEAGGNSIQAVELSVRLSELAGRELSSSLVLEHPSIAAQAALLDHLAAHPLEGPDGTSTLITLTGDRSRAGSSPIVLVSGTDGTAMALRRIAAAAGRRVPVVLGLDTARRLDDPIVRTDEMAELHVHALVEAGIEAPHLMGYSMGGHVVLRMANLLDARGNPPASVVLLDTRAARASWVGLHPAEDAARRIGLGIERRRAGLAAAIHAARRGTDVRDRARRFTVELRDLPGGFGLGGGSKANHHEGVARRQAIERARRAGLGDLDDVTVADGIPVLLIATSVSIRECGDPHLGWDAVLPLRRVVTIRASHGSVLHWRAAALAKAMVDVVA